MLVSVLFGNMAQHGFATVYGSWSVVLGLVGNCWGCRMQGFGHAFGMFGRVFDMALGAIGIGFERQPRLECVSY